jgi:hypothetical protein
MPQARVSRKASRRRGGRGPARRPAAPRQRPRCEWPAGSDRSSGGPRGSASPDRHSRVRTPARPATAGPGPAAGPARCPRGCDRQSPKTCRPPAVRRRRKVRTLSPAAAAASLACGVRCGSIAVTRVATSSDRVCPRNRGHRPAGARASARARKSGGTGRAAMAASICKSSARSGAASTLSPSQGRRCANPTPGCGTMRIRARQGRSPTTEQIMSASAATYCWTRCRTPSSPRLTAQPSPTCRAPPRSSTVNTSCVE